MSDTVFESKEVTEHVVYPNYHFKREKGERVHIFVEGQDWGSFDLETLDKEFQDPDSDETTRFVFREATEFLTAERR
jgi:hypothetical protein